MEASARQNVLEKEEEEGREQEQRNQPFQKGGWGRIMLNNP